MATFPLTPYADYPLAQSGYKESLLFDPTVRSKPDQGPPKTRPRYSTAIVQYAGIIEVLTSAEYDTLVNWYDSTLKYGALPFDWIHPRTGAAGTFKFLERPEIQGTVGIAFTVSMKFYKVP